MGLTPLRTQRVMSIEKLFGLTDPPPVKSLYHYEGLKGKIDVQSESINMVLSRDVRANVRIGAEMALTIARENPERDVWYVNTYAGVALMKDAFREAITNAAMPMPEPEYESDTEKVHIETEEEKFEKERAARMLRPGGPDPSRPWEKWGQGKGQYAHLWFRENAKESEQIEREMLAKRIAEAAERAAAFEATKPSPVLPNLHLFDVPLGQWDAEKLAGAIGEGAAVSAHHAEECAAVGAHHADQPRVVGAHCGAHDPGANPVLIINSFEYAPLNRNGKWRMAREILELQEAMSLTVVVFSHEMRVDLEAGLPGRGSVGLLAGQAGTVARLADPFEHLIRSRKPRNQPERGIVHEAQMLAPGGEESEKDAEEETQEDTVTESEMSSPAKAGIQSWKSRDATGPGFPARAHASRE